MAYAALVSLAQTIDILLHHHDQYSISLHKKQRNISTKYISFLKAFLEDFPEIPCSLEGQIRDVANEAENIIEYFMSEQIKLCPSKSYSEKSPHHLITGLFMWLQGKQRVIYTKLRLHSTFKKLQKVVKEAMQIKNSSMVQDAQLSGVYSSVDTSSSRLIAPTSKDGTMVGFDYDLMAIKARLCGESSKLQVIPIFGMGGIGKTTLARNAYNDQLTVEHFDVRAWVTVSLYCNPQEVLFGLLDSMKVKRSGQSYELTREIMYKRLKGRRYLIVMDDVWDTEVWDAVKLIFPNDCNGSRIILTTRLSDTAAYPDSSIPLHEMHLMDADQSWNLLQQKIFPQENCPPELETTGREIARSCGGLPLAIVLIAGLLSTVTKTQASWANIAENINLVISNKNDEQFARILSLSYTHLPHHLRPCFLYMGDLPEDYEIHVSKLTKLWVAEGFLESSGSKSFEEVAEEYLEDLVKRSLVVVIKMKPNGKIKSCSLHDLVRDLCKRIAQEEKCRVIVLNSCVTRVFKESIKNERRIITDDLQCLECIYGSTIRTIICFHPSGSSLRFLRNFRLLRILDVVAAHFTPFCTFALPIEAFELFHLRYLSFTCTIGFVLPPYVLHLQNLQTLIIHPESRFMLLSPLPLEIWRMRQLRHLIFYGPLPDIPEGAPTFPLENLQTLLGVTDFKCTEEILKMIPNLKKLGIIYSGKEYVEDSHLENLVHLHQLEKLKLEVYPFSPFKGKLDQFFSMTLKKLSLSNWGLPWEHMSILGLLPNLQVLKLRKYACSGDKWETTEGEFCQLKFLLIDDSDLQQWITESSHFSNLKCLVLYSCWKLIEIPDGIGEIPTLELIEVDGCKKSLVESAKRIQEEQQSLGNDALQVRIGVTWRK